MPDWEPNKDPESRRSLQVIIVNLALSPKQRESYMSLHNFCLLVREHLNWVEKEERHMPYWKPKTGPLLEPSRLWHFMIAAALSSALGFFFGYEGLGWSGLVLGGGWIWEASSKFIWKKQGHHSYGDLPDLLAFVLGWTIITIILLLMGVGSEAAGAAIG